MFRRTILSFLAIATLAGCQTTGGSVDQVENRKEHSVPANYKALVLAKLKTSLKDPYSVKSAEISAPSDGFAGLINGGTRPLVCTKFNSKNSFGAYVGIHTMAFFFNEGKIAGIIVRAQACNGMNYRPFPELEKLS